MDSASHLTCECWSRSHLARMILRAVGKKNQGPGADPVANPTTLPHKRLTDRLYTYEDTSQKKQRKKSDCVHSRRVTSHHRRDSVVCVATQYSLQPITRIATATCGPKDSLNALAHGSAPRRPGRPPASPRPSPKGPHRGAGSPAARPGPALAWLACGPQPGLVDG